MEIITRDKLEQMFICISEEMTENYEKLAEMDALLGDGDLGLTMKKGFAAMPGFISEMDEPDIGKAIAKAGMKLSSVIPSTMGFLMSSGLMTGGKSISGASGISPQELVLFIRGFADGIMKRGKCVPGERTVLDAFHNAAASAELALQKDPDASLLDIIFAAEEGARAGTEATRTMVPKYGKAAVHKAAAEGNIDQGAYAGQCFVTGLRKFIQVF